MKNEFITYTKKIVPLRCHRCKHYWEYGGKNEWYATCPNCRTYTSVKRNRVAREEKK